MIVFDLICGNVGHGFEGWFGSSSDYEDQRTRGLIACPVCGSTAIEKAVMAPNVGLKSNQTSAMPTKASASILREASLPAEIEPVSNAVQVSPEYKKLLGKLSKAQEKILEKSEWVGREFPETARAIHYGEMEEKQVHGEASPDEAAALEDEGIAVAPLPMPYVPPKNKN